MSHWQNFKRALNISALFVCGVSFGGMELVWASECHTQDYDTAGWVSKVHDGDTIRLRDGRVVRIIGLNTPELSRDRQPAQPLSNDARQALKALLGVQRRVFLKYGQQRRDRHKRILAHVFSVDGENIAATLLGQGYGFAVTVAPNVWGQNCYFAKEKQAAQQGLGVWRHQYYVSKASKTLTRADTGFQRIYGRVTNVSHSKKAIWVDMGSQLVLRIQRNNLQYFHATPIDKWVGQRIQVRGWLSTYKKKLKMSLSHPAMVRILD